MHAIIVGRRDIGLWIAWLIAGGVGRMDIGLLIVSLLGIKRKGLERLGEEEEMNTGRVLGGGRVVLAER
jgi:hypothetical protein